MTNTISLIAILTAGLALAGCLENNASDDTQDTNNQTNTTGIQSNKLSNGFYRSRVVMTKADGEVISDAAIVLNEADATLTLTDYAIERQLPPEPHDLGNYEYDSNGNLKHHKLTKKNGDTPFDKYYEYDADGKLIAASDTDKSNRQWKETYRYNTAGQLTARFRNLADDSVGAELVWSFAYDDAGNRQQMTADVPSIPGPGDSMYFKYDESNRLIESQLDSDTDGSIDQRRDYTYNEDGNIAQVTNYSGDGAMFLQTDYTYTATETNVFNETLFELLYAPH